MTMHNPPLSYTINMKALHAYMHVRGGGIRKEGKGARASLVG